MLPVSKQPTVEAIEAELTAYKHFQSAYLQKERPLPKIPQQPGEPSSLVIVFGLPIQFTLIISGWIAKKAYLRALRIWVARKRVALDGIDFERASCGLNKALTELGLSLLAVREHNGAMEVLASPSVSAQYDLRPQPSPLVCPGCYPRSYGGMCGVRRYGPEVLGGFHVASPSNEVDPGCGVFFSTQGAGLTKRFRPTPLGAAELRR